MKSYRSQNYYEVLGVPRGSSVEEIRDAYELSRLTYQDNSLATYSLFSDEENHEILTLISRAYETLFNPDLRKEYDIFLDKLGSKHRDAPLRRTVPPARGALRNSPPPLRGYSQPPLSPFAPPSAQSAQKPLPLRNASPDPPPAAQKPKPKGDRKAAEKYIQSISVFNGSALKKIRQLRGFSVEDIADMTKIRKTYIEYIEDEQLTFLPAEVYVKGFVTMIAGMLELPVKQVTEDYMSFYHRNDQKEG